MDTQIEPSSPHASRFAAVGRELERAADAASGAADVTAVLADIEAALVAIDRSCGLAASSLLPAGDGITDRYRRAAARWPDPAQAPSHEGQAAIRSRLDDTASAVRAAAHSCRGTRELLRAAGA
jgi:type II secretory pathway component HofQ